MLMGVVILIMDKQKKVKIRGTATLNLETNEFGFKPFEKGESTQRNVKTTKGGKVYETCSERKPKMVAYLTCDANAADPWSEYINQLKKLGVKPQKPVELPTEQRVVNEQGLECWLNEKQGKLTFTGTIDLTRHNRDWQAETLRLVQLVVRRLPACETFNKIINEVKKGGN